MSAFVNNAHTRIVTEAAAKRAMVQLAKEALKQEPQQPNFHIDVPFFVKMEVAPEELVRPCVFFRFIDRILTPLPQTEETEELVDDIKNLLEEANEMVHKRLNEQTSLMFKWRKRLVTLLTRPLTSEDSDDKDGEEYLRSLDTQGEVEAYLQAYTALLADRREAMTSERTILATHIDKGLRTRDTTAARNADEAIVVFENELPDGIQADAAIDPQPEHQVLQHQLSEARRALLQDSNNGRAIRSVMVDLNNLAACIDDWEDPVRIIAKDGAGRLRRLILDQGGLFGDPTHSQG